MVVNRFTLVLLIVKQKNQVVTSSNDRSILIWEPAMDILLHDSIESKVKQMYKDTFSDDEFV